MMDLIELIDRQYSYLDGMHGSDYVLQLRRWLQTLNEVPQLSLLLQDMNEESKDLLNKYFEHDDLMVPRLVALRAELVVKASELDDSQIPPPAGFDPTYSSSLAYFDRLAQAPGGGKTHGKPHGDRDDLSRSAALMRILRDKLDRAMHWRETGEKQFVHSKENLRPDLGDISRRLGDCDSEHTHTFREFVGDKLTSPGVALAQLVFFLSDLNPNPEPWTGDLGQLGPELERRMSGYGELREEVFEGKRKDVPTEKKKAAIWEGRMRAHVRRVHEDLRQRIGTRRSLLALLHRFKERCEWHDRDRLRRIAHDSARGEDALTAELARWLFDQGMSPLTRPLAGGLQPDLFEPSKLYVEAKRYGKASSSRKLIVQGFHELFDAVQRLKGTKYEITEAFYVVFREGGPRYVLPSAVPGDGWVTLPLVIDIAPLSESGSRQRHQPVSIGVEELSPKS